MASASQHFGTLKPQISVIIPYGYRSQYLDAAIQSANAVPAQIEILIVTNSVLANELQDYKNQGFKIIESREKGRGQFCVEGAKVAKGEILLFLHADTILPKHWNKSVIETLSDPSIGGGGFTVHFDSKHWFVSRIPKLYNLFSKMIRELWGDRAMFLRRDDLIPFLSRAQIPIMEDVEMSKIMHIYGKQVILRDSVSTSAIHFTVKGHFRHLVEVLVYRTLYMFGVSAATIYQWYYRSNKFSN